MKFTVTFVGQLNNNGSVATIHDRKLGTKDIDRIRQEAGEEVPINVIQPTTPFTQLKDLTVELTEEQARASGLFETTHHVKVAVGTNAFKRFFQEEAKISRSPKGQVIHAEITTVIYHEDVLNAWIEAGYPSPWMRIVKVQSLEEAHALLNDLGFGTYGHDKLPIDMREPWNNLLIEQA